MVFVWEYGLSPMGGVWAIYELLPAFLVSLAVIIVVIVTTIVTPIILKPVFMKWGPAAVNVPTSKLVENIEGREVYNRIRK